MSDPAHTAITGDNRTLNIWTSGAGKGPVVVFHRGTPDPPAPWPAFDQTAERHGLRVVSYARPGYSGSSPHPGRSVADAATDTIAVLDELGVEEFISLGHSGGGPHALACGALIPDRCRAVATIASVAPYPAAGLDWLDGMAEENVDEFGHALEGEESYRKSLLEQLEVFANVTADDVAAALGGLLPDVDRAVVTGEQAELSASNLRRVARDGLEGWVEDGLAFVEPWGFSVDQISVPVSIWQGRHDKMVPFGHGRWLVEHIPGVNAHLSPDDGHVTVIVNRLDEIFADAKELAGL